MLSDRDALLAAIRANPEEDTPRLMFADWLDENGEADRAEFIRLQCELARFADQDSDSFAMYAFLHDGYEVGLSATDWTRIDDGVHRLVALKMRTEDLLKQHRDDWEPKLPKKHRIQWDGFHRGFPHRVTFDDARNIGPVADRLRAVPPVTLVTNDFRPALVGQLARAGLLGWVAGLELTNDCAAGLRDLGRRPEAAKIRELSAAYSHDLNTIAALANSPCLSGLRSLDLSSTPLDTEDSETLFSANHLRTLKRLTLGGLNWTTDTVRAFAAGGFTELTSLRFTDCGLDDDAAEVLAKCPHLANLRALDLADNRITGRGVTALLCSPHLANLTNLCLDGNPCNGLDAGRLAALAPAALRLLHFHGSRLRTADVRALARCPRLRTLWYFDLDENNIGTPAVRELVRGFGKWCPPILWLTYNRIDDRGAEVLANWKAAAGLSALHVKYNRPMTDAGVRALLDSPNLTNLDALGASAKSAKTKARLRARFKYDDHY